MISAPKMNRFAFFYTNADAPSATQGTSVTPGASNVEGTYTQIASSANIANDIWEFHIGVHSGGTSGSDKSQLMDIGIDEAGGTSYTAIISNIVMGMTGTSVVQGVTWFKFPMKIKAGSSVAVRIQGSNATAGTVRVIGRFFGKPSAPELCWLGAYSETIGTITNSSGPTITSGTSGAEGSWTSIGTTSKLLKWWQIGIQISNATITSGQYHWDVSYGDGTNKHIIIENAQHYITSTTEQGCVVQMDPRCYCEVPSGSTIYVRVSCSLGTASSNCNCTVIGIG